MGCFIEPKSDTFFKSGLAKSAFHYKIYEALPLDYYLPFIISTQKMFFTLSERFYPKFYQAHDAFLMHYKSYSIVYQSLKKTNKVAPLWRLVIERTLKDPQFLDLNKITANSTELSILAATRFLRTLLRELDVEKLQQQYKDSFNALSQQQQRTLTQKYVVDSLIQLVDEATRNAVQSAIETVQEYREAKETAEEAVSVLGGGQGGASFSKEALSIIRFLNSPDEFRKRVALLKYAKIYFSKFFTAVPTSMIHEQIVSVYGGVNGVTRMFSEKQIPDILPSELALAQLGEAGRALLAVKIAQKQLMTYQRSASVKPVIFVDKSGSMAEVFEGWKGDSAENPPKISVASGLALALYRKLNADVYLFDTEIEKVAPAKVVETLLRIDADGGTDIDPVLEEIMRIGKAEYVYIIISDGITEANPEVLQKFKEESGLVKRTRLILISPTLLPSSSVYNWVKLLQEHDNVEYATNVAKFESAVKRFLSF
jgi:uncharacterized protein with von Willebrand factor type A (vWA) domain